MDCFARTNEFTGALAALLALHANNWLNISQQQDDCYQTSAIADRFRFETAQCYRFGSKF